MNHIPRPAHHPLTRRPAALRRGVVAAMLALGLLMAGTVPDAGRAFAETVIGAGTTVDLSGPPEMRAEQTTNDAPGPSAADKGTHDEGQEKGQENSPSDRQNDESAGADAAPASASDARNAALPEGPMPAQPVVVELYTAQGCSTCQPADALLADMADRGDLLALSFHVDYWDYLGWPDEFAAPPFTQRQEAYARSFGERGLYTPQIIVGGTDTLLTPRPADLDMLISAHQARPPAIGVTVKPEGARHVLTLTPYRDFSGMAEILLLRYLPARAGVIEAGENHGRRFSYRNIVSRMDKLADWDGKQALRLTVSSGGVEAELTDARGAELSPDTRHAIIVQQTGPGAILAAIRLD